MNKVYQEYKEYLLEYTPEELNFETRLYYLGRFHQELDLNLINENEYNSLLEVAKLSKNEISLVLEFKEHIKSYDDWKNAMKKFVKGRIQSHYKYYLQGRLDVLGVYGYITYKEWEKEHNNLGFTEKEKERLNL